MKNKLIFVIFVLLIYSLSVYSQTQSSQDASNINNALVSGVFDRKSINSRFEIAISPDVYFGLEAGYSYNLVPTEVNIQVGDEAETSYPKEHQKEFWASNKLDDVRLGGIKLGAKLSISLPPLF